MSFAACALQETHLHVTSPPAHLSWHNLLLFVEHNRSHKFDLPLCKCEAHTRWWQHHCPTPHCEFSSNSGVDWGKLVLNIERGFKYHAVSSFARFIESTATQKNKILINVAYLLQLSYDFSVLLFCFFCVASRHSHYYLLPNPFSLFLLLSFDFATTFGCQSALISVFMLLFITV